MNEVLLGVFDIHEAKKIKNILAESGIETELRTNDQTCTRGCKITVELWGNDKNKEELIKFFRSEYMKNLEGHEVNFEALQEVFDPNAEVVTCQACGAKFSPKLNECPECGLMY